MTTYDQITDKLSSLNPSHLELINESMQHAGYFEGKESHFKLTLVSPVFDGKRLVARHQKVFEAVQPLLTANGGTVHALAIHAYTPDEWQTMQTQNQPSPASPLCASQQSQQ